MTIVEQLENKKKELEERHRGHHSTWGSKAKETLEYKIKILDKLVAIYQTTPPPLVSSEVEEAFKKQVGFEELKSKILDNLKIILVVGPTGCGKTTSARWLSQALKRELFTINLVGLSDSSALFGTSESSSGTEIGQLAKALVETQSQFPLILLDEFDKIKPFLRDSLLTVLDLVQNQAVLDYYLDVKLDFSQVIFLVTANDLSKIPEYWHSRLPRVELTGYTLTQKKAIVQQFIQEFFADKVSLKSNFEITPFALETLINKTKEKGVRQLKQACDKIFNYCLARWNEIGNSRKITINPSLVDQVISDTYFVNVEQEDNQPNEKEQINQLQKELNSLKKEVKTSSQTKLKAARFRSLSLIQQKLNNAKIKKENLGELSNYEQKIKQVNSLEEIEVLKEEVLLQIEYQNTLQNSTASRGKDKLKKTNKWAEIEKLSQILEEKWRNSLHLSNLELENLKKKFQDLQKSSEKSMWNVKNNVWFILLIVFVLTIGVVYFIKPTYKQRERERERERDEFQSWERRMNNCNWVHCELSNSHKERFIINLTFQ